MALEPVQTNRTVEVIEDEKKAPKIEKETPPLLPLTVDSRNQTTGIVDEKELAQPVKNVTETEKDVETEHIKATIKEQPELPWSKISTP